MQILLLGCGGFLGRHILNMLLEISNISILAVGSHREIPQIDSSRIKYINGDLTSKSFVDSVINGQDVVVHCAGVSTGSKDLFINPTLQIEDNAIMNTYILSACARTAVKKFIFPSCTLPYQKQNRPFIDVAVKEEEDFLNEEILDIYRGVGWTKVYAEKLCSYFSSISPMNTYCLRLSNVYGPYDKFNTDKSHLMAAAITKVLKNEGVIDIWGDGTQERDFIYIDDVVSAFKYIILNELGSKHEIYNIGSGTSISALNLFEKVIKISNCVGVKIVTNPEMKTVNTKVILDISKAHKQLNWFPLIDLEQGILKTVEWYRQKFQLHF